MAAPNLEVLVPPPGWPLAPDDPFRYGWRYLRHPRPDGTEEFEQVPLALEDVLHPQEGDFIVQSDAHERRCRYLRDVIGAQLADDPTAVALHDVRVAWDVPGLKAHGPDIAVILGVRERRNWSTFDVAREGVRPAMLIEVTSPETAQLDRSMKVDEYDLAGVPLYIIVDTVLARRRPTLRLLGYTQTPEGYQVLPPDERGRLWLAPARAWLGITDNEIICYDEEGDPLGDYQVLAANLAAAEGRAEAAEGRAVAAEARATAEAEARAAAEARLRDLEAELRRLRGAT